MKYDYTVLIPNEDPDVYHIPGVHNTQMTLCGWVDASSQECCNYVDHPVNCKSCVDAYKQIKAMKFPKDYFKAE